MTSREDLRQALGSANTRAFLRVIREGETDQTPLAYKKLVGDPRGVYSIAKLTDHPRRVVAIPSLNVYSSAAGAYQFLAKTWDGLVAKFGFEDFSPSNQDEGAVALIAGRGVLEALLAGRLLDVLDKTSYEWASLPPGRYGQPTISEEQAVKVYKRWGGQMEEVA